MSYILFHSTGCGSVLPLTILTLLNVPHELVTLDYEATTTRQESEQFKRLLSYNPLAQFPTLVTPDGAVITEMAAMVLYLNDQHAKGTPWSTNGFSPAQLAAFYRWLVFIPANVYPTITIAEFPERYLVVPESAAVTPEAVHGWLKETTGGDRRKETWSIIENHLGHGLKRVSGMSFILDTKHPTFLDLYLAVVAHYAPHPRFQWIEQHCPIVLGAVRETLKVPQVRKLFEENDLVAFL